MSIQILSLQYPESNCQDAMVSSVNPSLPFPTNIFLRCGRDSTGSKWRIYIKPDITDLPSKADILTALVKLMCYEASGGSFIFDVHKITGSWSESSLNWSNQPSYDFTPVYSYTLNILTNQWYDFNILDLVKLWIVNIIPHYGIMIKARDENITNHTSFYSSAYSTQGSRPIFYFEYQLQNKNINPILLGQGGGILL